MTTERRRANRAIIVTVVLLVLVIVGAVAALLAGRALGVRSTVDLGEPPSGHEILMVWYARILLVLAIAWVVIGMLSARTRLVRRPGAAAARASWLGATRPWRARESTLGFLPLDRWLIIAIPAGLFVATRGVQTSFASWSHLVVVVGAWMVFALLVRLLVGSRSPWPVISAVGGVMALRCILTLAALSVSGPGGYWHAFWTDPWQRGIYVTVAFALFLWVFVAAGWTISTQLGPRRATGAVLAAVGGAAIVPATAVAFGFGDALTVWSDEIGLLPWGRGRILDVATFADVPAWSGWYVLGLAAVLIAVGLVLVGAREKERQRRSA